MAGAAFPYRMPMLGERSEREEWVTRVTHRCRSLGGTHSVRHQPTPPTPLASGSSGEARRVSVLSESSRSGLSTPSVPLLLYG